MDSGQDSGQDTGTPLVDAAAIMGTTPAALRKRLQRGSVPGYKREGQWFVLVDTALPTGTPRAPHGQDTALARTADQRAADLTLIIDQVAAMFEARLVAKDEALAAKDETIKAKDAGLAAKDQALAADALTIAELRRRAEVAEAGLQRRLEADQARILRQAEAEQARQRAEEAALSAQDAPRATEAPTVAEEEAAGVWMRLRRWWGS